MPQLGLAILLVFPMVEIILLIVLASWWGLWVLLWLLVAACWGVAILRREQVVMPQQVLSALTRGTPMTGALVSTRRMMAGMLLIFPGVISDMIAIFLLLSPSPRPRLPSQDVIEGEWRREE